jgi:hypothetical protein
MDRAGGEADSAVRGVTKPSALSDQPEREAELFFLKLIARSFNRKIRTQDCQKFDQALSLECFETK